MLRLVHPRRDRPLHKPPKAKGARFFIAIAKGCFAPAPLIACHSKKTLIGLRPPSAPPSVTAGRLGFRSLFGPERERDVNNVSLAPPTYRQPATLEHGKHGCIVCKHIGLKGR